MSLVSHAPPSPSASTRSAAAGLVVEQGDGKSTGGRPPTRLAFNSDGGVVLAADFGATQCRLAVSDRAGSVLVEEATDLDIAAGPDACLRFALDGFHALLDRAGRAVSSVEGVGVGLPGPVEFAAGRVVSPPIMPGWDGVPVPPFSPTSSLVCRCWSTTT